MPRRKQNTPKRLKSEDGSDGGTVDADQPGDASGSDSDIENNNMDESSDSASEQSEEENQEPAGESKDNKDVEKDKTGYKNDENNSPEIEIKPNEKSNEDNIDQCTERLIDTQQIDSEKMDSCDKNLPIPKETEDVQQNLDKNCEDKEWDKSKTDTVTQGDDVSDVKSTDIKNSFDISQKSKCKDMGVSGEKSNSPEKENSNRKNDKRHSKSKVKNSLQGSTSSEGNIDGESPISKLLNMVNNPEKIQSRHSHSFSLPASTPILPGRVPGKSSSPVTSSAVSASSQLRSSKPLSGFLPPYSMLSQLQSMYNKMSQNYTSHSKEEKLNGSSQSVLSSSSSKDKKPQVKSSPSPSPVSDQDQPLDLSVKSKGLDLTVKAKADELALNGELKSVSGNKKYIPTSNSTNLNSSEVSSLKSLEEKFGGNPFKFDKNRGMKTYMPYIHPMLPMYGGALYTTALFNTHPWMHTEKLSRSEYPTVKPSSKSSNQSTTIPSKPSSQTEAVSPCKLSPPTLAKLTDKDSFYNKKYTNLRCSCKKEFETLYHLTLHLKQSGHTPSNRIGSNQEFPKLVRGQDMWLNHGSEQTKQILRCIRCGESFKTLPDLTVHMMKTKHYTNIVGSDANRKLASKSLSDQDIFKCFQCDESFAGMEEFSKHMIISGHHKSPIIIQPMSPGMVSPGSDQTMPKGEHSREPSPKRQRTLSDASSSSGLPSMVKYSENFGKIDQFSERDDSSWDSFTAEDNKIRCETCGDKIEMSKFVDHVRQCIRNTPWDYCTPLKKRRLDDQVSKKEQSESNCGEKLNGHYKSSSPKASDFLKDALLVQPSDESEDGSALRAMESFIEQSFTPSKKDKNFYGLSSMSRSVFPIPFVNGHSPKSPSRNSTTPVSSSLYYSKYLPPLYLNPSDDTTSSHENKTSSESTNKSIEKSIQKFEVTTENNNTEIKVQDGIKLEKEEKCDRKTPSPSKLKDKYLHLSEQPYSPSSERTESKSNASALESLQGLVYGKSYDSDHPLNSLQKLLHNADAKLPNGAYDSTSVNKIRESFSASGLLKTPVVANRPASNMMSPAPQSPHESTSSPAQGSHHSDPISPGQVSVGDNIGNAGGSEEDEGETQGDAQGEYTCETCGKNFTSIGLFHFHGTRCPLNKSKNFPYKEKLTKTPYVYLPLDHSAKFNKYYELANELANSTK